MPYSSFVTMHACAREKRTERKKKREREGKRKDKEMGGKVYARSL